jgi:hypothetical protein
MEMERRDLEWEARRSREASVIGVPSRASSTSFGHRYSSKDIHIIEPRYQVLSVRFSVV